MTTPKRITETQEKEFYEGIRILNKAMKAIKRKYPMANYYLDGTSNFCLFLEEWDGDQSKIAAEGKILNSSGGDW